MLLVRTLENTSKTNENVGQEEMTNTNDSEESVAENTRGEIKFY